MDYGLHINIDSPAHVGAAALLDTYAGAVGAYSLRELVAGVTNVVRVRRSSDDTESDFTASEVADGTLTAWVGGGGYGYVTTLYDQSDNASDATQATFTAQPNIVFSGSLVTENGLPAMECDTGEQMDLGADLTLTSGHLIALVCRFDSNSSPVGQGAGNSFIWLNSTTNVRIRRSGTDSNHTVSDPTGNQVLLVAEKTSADLSRLGMNGVETSSSTNSNDFILNSLFDGYSGTSLSLDGVIQEVVIWNSDMSDDRAAISAEINAHYSIY